MKKIIITLIFACSLVSLFGQATIKQNAVGSYDNYTGSAADTLGTLDSTWSRTYNVFGRDSVQVAIYFDIDTSTGTTPGNTDVKLQGSLWPVTTANGLTYTTIDSCIWTGASDTTITFETTTNQGYQYFKALVEGSDDDVKAEIQLIYFKIFEKQ